MLSQQNSSQETWVKILSKGIITIPKDLREQIGLQEGDVAKVKVVDDKLIIEPRKKISYKEYRVFSKEEVDKWIAEDRLPKSLANQTKSFWADKMK